MTDFAGQTIVSNFIEGLSGQSAVAAEESLKTSKFKSLCSCLYDFARARKEWYGIS